jgi:hypothetical protein
MTMMTRKEIEEKADEAIVYAAKIPDPTMHNYQDVFIAYKSVLKHVLVMIRDLARNDPTT